MSPSPHADPRPLTGEPLSIDLLNTRWVDAGVRHDLLDSTEGLAVWLESESVRPLLRDVRVVADRRTLDALLKTRAALAQIVTSLDRPAPEAIEGLNEVLEHGRIRRLLRPDGGPETTPEADVAWLPAWLAAENWLTLVADRPERIRPCANHECVLHFYDISKNGTRRWCSMTACGNRAKAQRHYDRHRRN
ncbi:CGNR zinc finger domain-containing protein [Streptomyces sp. NPDC026672]|uniref:CGNR zinc finger domain-containing protein n=1 Tax=unclassified Streptomyces TaxID=2593676 RepID=UPI0033E74599